MQLKDNINWVGYADFDVRDFHGYHTPGGSTYNAYLCRGQKHVLIDAVKAPFAHTLLQHIQELIDDAPLDYIICNHAEPDHASALPSVLEAYPQAVVLCNQKCHKALSAHMDTSAWKVQIVEDGSSLELGNRTFTFINTPQAHWPESMMTWLPEERILFSMDAFGQHIATDHRFDHEDPDIARILHEARVYYANILMPVSKAVAKALHKLQDINPEIIAPSHGIIWQKHIDQILQAYRSWSSGELQQQAVILYDTMWQSTGRMAQAIAAGLKESGWETAVHHVRRSSLTDIATDILDAGAIAVGSPVLNKTMMPQVAAALTYLKGLNISGRPALAFGSYGWGKGGAQEVHEYLEAMKCHLVKEPLRSQYVPGPDELETCREAGRALAAAAAASSSAS